MLNQSINQSIKKKRRCFKSNLSYTIQVVVIVSFSSSIFLVLVFLMFCLTVPHSFSVRYCQVPTWTWTSYILCKVRVMWLGWPVEHKLSGQVPSPAGKANQDLHKVLQQMKAWLALKPPGIRLLRWLTQLTKCHQHQQMTQHLTCNSCSRFPEDFPHGGSWCTDSSLSPLGINLFRVLESTLFGGPLEAIVIPAAFAAFLTPCFASS